MTGIEYIVKMFEVIGVTDAFGIPGGVILDFMAMLSNNSEIKIHLSYHEQGAGFSAVGFSQISNRPSVAYATHGPGILNMATAIYDAYLDSVPVIFVTAHNFVQKNPCIRIERDQEINFAPIFRMFTKSSEQIETIDDLVDLLPDVLIKAVNPRMGPVFLDFNTKVFSEKVKASSVAPFFPKKRLYDEPYKLVDQAAELIKQSKRPVILAGDGINLSGAKDDVINFANKHAIPIISSKYAQDINSDKTDLIFGYIGSHGLRHANFILSKSDCIIAIGNRLSFPFDSPSYRNIVDKKAFVRIDIDANEFTRKLPKSIDICGEISNILQSLSKRDVGNEYRQEWVELCLKLKERLWDMDLDSTCIALAEIIRNFNISSPIVCDVGNNELKLMRGYAYGGFHHRVIHSKTMKTAGCGVPKAIGAYYSIRGPVICVTGDQGFQFNLQELEAVRDKKLPILFIVINNESSGMLLDQEERKAWEQHIHVSKESGYLPIDIEGISAAYHLPYVRYSGKSEEFMQNLPCICEIRESCGEPFYPVLPKGEPCQNLFPFLEDNLYTELDKL